VTLIIMLAMADAFGLLGIVVAPPLSAVCQIVWNLSAGDRLASGATVHIMDLNERQEHLRTVIAEMETAPPPLIINSMDRLAALLKKAQPILPVTLPIEASESKLPLP